MTLQEFIRQGRELLEKNKLHFANSQQHIEQLVLRTLHWTATDLCLKKDEMLDPANLEKLKWVLNRRVLGEPLQYILGFEYFYDSMFEVGPGCLIPRKETELLVDEILAFEKGRSLRVAELGAGSGNIGISVMLERSNIEWHAFEINPESVVFTKRNVDKLLPKGSDYFLHEEDFFGGAGKYFPYDVVVSNPPYISEKEFEELAEEVKKEPALALKAKDDGLEVVRRLIDSVPMLLKPQGLFLSEIGSSQGETLERELKGRFEKFEILKDLAGLPRVLKIVKPV